jgi:expansin (peptidoglycan-binding protein)
MKVTFALLITAVLTQAAPILVKRTSGTATYYDVGLGSCGEENSNDEMVVALSPDRMDGGEACGRTIQVDTEDGSVSATVVDTCPGCDYNSIDLSPAAFDNIGDQARGRIDVTWHWD